MIATRLRRLTVIAILVVSAISACADISDQSWDEIAPSKAIGLLTDKSRMTPLPASFTPIKAFEGRITQGSSNDSVEIAFSATQSDLNTFLNDHHAQMGPPYFQSAGCVAPIGRYSSVAPLTKVFTSTWFTSVFPKCSVLEYAQLPNTEWLGQRTNGGVYRVVDPGAVAANEAANLVLTFATA